MSICYVNGSYEDKNSAMISIQDRGFNFSDGVYEVMSFFGNQVVNFDKHVKRLEKSLSGLRIQKPLTNYKSLELILKKLIKLNKEEKGFVYLQITRGSSSRNHLFPKLPKPNIVIFTFTAKLDKKLIQSGVKVRLTEDLRWKRCDIKSISLLPNVLEKQNAFEEGMYESWQIRKNFITEGATSNAFIVNRNGFIQTHPANNFILGGVTRDTLIEIAKKNKIKVIEKAFSSSDLLSSKEAFLTSTTAKILPVVKINEKKIGNGKPGQMTQVLIKKYDELVKCQIHE